MVAPSGILVSESTFIAPFGQPAIEDFLLEPLWQIFDKRFASISGPTSDDYISIRE